MRHGAYRGSDFPAAIKELFERTIAYTNVRKHAHATTVSIIVEQRNESLRAVIEDNGLGFAVAEVNVAEAGCGGRHVGLIGMRERATLAGGTLTIESEPGSGTTIYCMLPMQTDAT